MRLQKFLAMCGVASRRTAETLIVEGRVRVNGEIAQLGQVVDPEIDLIFYDGQRLLLESKIYILLNKPANTITTVRDTHDRKTVIDCIEGVPERVFPVGRLDLDVEGALLLTNDGELAHRMMHPRYEMEKTYLARVIGEVTPETLDHLAQGVELDDGMTAPAQATLLRTDGHTSNLCLIIHEGRKRQVKRMCEAVGHRVLHLRRAAIGKLSVSGLRPGEWRHLTEPEIRRLYKLVGLKP